MTSHTDIERRLITIIAKSLQIPEQTVKLDSRLMLDLEAESIDILDIRFAVEQAFGIKFDNEEIRTLLLKAAAEHNLSEKDIPQFFTVERFYEYIVLKINQKADA
ncbi:MAG TPA: phosphopantetheine-binding protein [Saprospiraceae bacterium]|nr:phosphopantetheine-binding protein [Saprospiraceae bacterium]HND88256.1 phosphopantetheine-binding protein [Saprospiraceae bacterium]HNG89380.1 phosphopantetheine-binding protein [Saprospiraceae bacterium]